MKLGIHLLSLLGVVSTASALSCFCADPNPTTSNALYTKKYAVKVRVITKIESGAPVDPHMPASWGPLYYRAKVKNIFKQGAVGDLIDKEDVVVRAGGCTGTPAEKTPYIVISDSLTVMDVPGYGKAKVLVMPSYCEFNSKWQELPEERLRQLRRYKRKGETPCFASDCGMGLVGYSVECPGDANNVYEYKEVCAYNPKANQCQKDVEIENCPPLTKPQIGSVNPSSP